MNYDEFIKEYNGKSFDYDGVSGVQCVDLIKMYVDKVFGIKPSSWGNAKDYYENYENLPLKNYFTKIAYKLFLVPQKGDIVVFGTEVGNIYGHISIATGDGDTKQFYSYDLNWNGKTVKKVEHNYTGVLGVLRPNDQSKIVNERYKVGTVYTTQVDLKVRVDAGTDAIWKKTNELTTDGQKNAYEQENAVLKTGTKVTCQEVKNIGSDIWIKIPSGWVAGYYQGKEYIK